MVPLRLDAARFGPAPRPRRGQKGRPRLKGQRLPPLAARLKNPKTSGPRLGVPWDGPGQRRVEVASGIAVGDHSGKIPVLIRWVRVRDPRGRLETRALLSSDPTPSAPQIVEWVTRRGPVEVTFEAARAPLGLETQRPWNSKAIPRPTPVLLGLFSVVPWMAHRQPQRAPGGLRPRGAAGSSQSRVRFSDARAGVRDPLWKKSFCRSAAKGDSQKLQNRWLNPISDLLCYAQ